MIGVFDSGFGGLTVCREIIKRYPGQDIVFFADIANFPYGSKSKAELRQFSKDICNFLITEGVDLIVVACNSASSVIDEEFRSNFDLPIFDVINSGVKSLEDKDIKHLGLIATEATINSGILEEKIKNLGIKVTSKPAPELVELAQNMEIGEQAEKVVSNSLDDFKSIGIDAFYLGCTHFSLIRKEIEGQINAKIIDPAKQTSIDLEDYIETKSGPTNLYFHCSQEDGVHKESVKKILGDLDVRVR